ncbi:MAG: rhodanese-like domain-containing protein [Rickettsiales bacterium]
MQKTENNLNTNYLNNYDLRKNTNLKIFNFYSFNNILKTEEELINIKNILINCCAQNNILGTILIAKEGFNGQLSSEKDNLNIIYNLLIKMNLDNFNYKFADVSFIPFKKLKIKIKPDVIGIGCELKNINSNVGIYINPEDWDQEIIKQDAILIDTRNEYEFNAGTFKGAINPNIETFREFPIWVEKNFEKLNLQNKKIYMFCTGGIRCEKSTAFFQEKYNIKTYHLKGGILDYLYITKNKNNLWIGDCFVFDDRILVDKQDYIKN